MGAEFAPQLIKDGPISNAHSDIISFVGQYPGSDRWTAPDIHYAIATLDQFWRERRDRAKEIDTDDIERVHIIIAKLFYGFPPNRRKCVDDRIRESTFSGLISGGGPGGGASYSGPAGNAEAEFYRPDGGELQLRPDGNLAKSIISSPATYRVEVADSHIACAAQALASEGHPEAAYDGGLYENVMIQKGHNEALKRYKRFTPSGKSLPEILGIQITTDPHNGFSFMGLERKASLARATTQSDGTNFDGFSESVIKELSDAGEIISTLSLAESDLFQLAFNDVREIYGDFNADWVNAKAATAVKFWTSIEYLVERQPGATKGKTFMDEIESLVIKLYPDLGKVLPEKIPENLRQLELRHRAMLLMTNTYSGYLANRDGFYLFSKHKGDIVAVMEHTHGPFNLQAYVVSKDNEEVGTAVALSCTLVRNDRVADSTSKTNGLHEMDHDSFVEAPILVPVKIEVKGELSMQDKLFLSQYVPGKGPRLNFQELRELGLSPNLLDAIAELEEVVAKIYTQQARDIDYLRHPNPDKPEQRLLNVYDDKIFIVPLLIDKINKPLKIIMEAIPTYLDEPQQAS
jgi:hypothetical protein